MADAPLLAPGLVIADTYEVERLLGKGGMGEVWAARHRRLVGKQVAVKVLHVQVNVSAEALARFRREAEIAARLEHPNIVQVLDYNTLPSGEPFLVMELLKGESLAERLRGGPLPVPDAQHVIRQVGAALQAAHAAGVVHRDLKPENIFLVPTALGDQVKVLDFGISKLANSSTVQTTDSVLIGTPLYMSPEQALGNNSEVTAKSDLFSMGSIAYEMLAGRPPFLAESIATVVYKIVHEKHVPLATARPDVPAEVAEAVEQALAKDPAGRPADIAALVLAATGTPLVSSGPRGGVYQPGMKVSDSLVTGKTMAHTPARAEPPPRARRGTSGTVVAVALLVVVGVLFATVYAVRRFWSTYPVAGLDAGAAPDAGEVAVQQPPVDGGGPAVAVAPEPPAVAEDGGAPPEPVAVVRPPRRVAEPDDAPTPEDLAILARLEATAARGDWEQLENQRATVHRLTARSARQRGLTIVIDALCRRQSNQVLSTFIGELKRVAAPATVRKVKEQCLAVYEGAASLW